MRDAILVEKIIELMSIARIADSQNTHACEFAIAAKPPPPHDQCVHDRLAHGGGLRPTRPATPRPNMNQHPPAPCHPAPNRRPRALAPPSLPPRHAAPPRPGGLTL